VVADGDTLIEVPVTVPIPLMESEVAPETVQDSVELAPRAILVGFAVKLEMVGIGATVTVVCAVTEPALLVAVRV
jgi:hypothetical protein